MELHQLRYFLAVARLRNFSRAAAECHVAQPSLSQQIKKLEDELGEKLFERTKRKVSLTSAGEVFHQHAEHALEAMDSARESVREVRGVVRGRVSLGALPTIAPYFLPARLRQFAARHPAVEIVVHEDTTANLVAAVRAREIDVAFVSLPVDRAGLDTEELFEEPLLITLPARHPLARRRTPPLTLTALEGENFILMKEGHCLTGQALRFCQLKGFAPRVSFRSAQIETILSFVASGWGISIVPSMAHRPAHDGIAYRRVAGLRRSIGIITRAGRTLSREVREIIAFFRSRAKR